MTRQFSLHRSLISLAAFLCLPLLADAQVTLTGAAWFYTDSTGATNTSLAYEYGFVNTLSGDQWWDLWLALNPDATSPVNGPADTQAPISIPLEAGKRYKYYFFSECCAPGYNGLTLYFDGNTVNPGISVFGPVEKYRFNPNNSEILSLQGNAMSSVGSSFYSSDGLVAVLTEFIGNNRATPPGDVCQAFSFTPDPDGSASGFGSFTLNVFNAAAISASEPSGFPLQEMTLTGSGFAPSESVSISADHLGLVPLGSVSTDNSGSFSATIRLPQHPYGTFELFALGLTSNNLGTATLSVTAAVATAPELVEPGSSVAAEGVGFGSGELVRLYLDNPRELLGVATANELGSFVGSNAPSITIPAGTPSGLNALIGIGETTGAFGLGKVRVE